MAKRTWIAGATLLIANLTGCGALDDGWQKKLPWSTEPTVVESQYERPMRMAAIWTADVLTTPGQPTVRGFGGRLYFYNQKSQPIPVDGQLVVYAYDDSIEAKSRKTPDRKYAFTPDQFTQHYSESELGASYSVWLPWDRVGGYKTSISLVPVFTSTNGQVVMGHQALNLLPGKNQEKPLAATEGSVQVTRSVEQVGYNQGGPSAGHANPFHGPAKKPRMQTTTISVPASMRERLRQATDANKASGQSQTRQLPGQTLLPPTSQTRLPPTPQTRLPSAASTGRPTTLGWGAPALGTSGTMRAFSQLPARGGVELPPTNLPTTTNLPPVIDLPGPSLSQRNPHPRAATPAGPVPNQRSARFAPMRRPVPVLPISQSDRAAVHSPRHLARPRSAHPFSQQPGSSTATPGY